MSSGRNIQLAEGKYYVTANGGIVGPMRATRGEHDLFVSPNSKKYWTPSGITFPSHVHDSNHDIVSISTEEGES